jgi:PAS domain S-box-containing protein
MKRVIKFIFKRRSIQSKVLTHFGLVILVLFLSLLSVCGVMLHQLTQIEKKVYSVSSINGLLFELVKLESDVTLFNPSHTYETEKKRSLALHEINMKRSKLEHSFILSPNSSLPGYEQAPVKLIKEAIQSHKKKFDNVIAMVRQVQVKKLSFSQEIKAQVQLENLRIDARTDLEKAFAVNEDLLGVLEKDAHVIRLRNFRTLAWLSVLLFAIGAFTFQSLAESFSVPINLLKKFATAVGEGNHVPDLKKSRILEIEDLSQAMNKMAETLEKRTVSQNFLESILEAVLDPIFVINNQGKIKKANRAALRILGTSAPELFQQNLKDYLQSSDGTPLALFHSPGYKVVDLNLLIKSQGGFTPISFSCSPVNKTNEGFVCIARDISEQLLVNEKLVNHQKTIIELSKMSALGEMASGISHEINNPLNVIGSINDLIAFAAESQEYDRPTIIGYTQKIEKMISRISKIIKGLRVFARDGSQDPFQEVSLNTILEDTLELCQSRMEM